MTAQERRAAGKELIVLLSALFLALLPLWPAALLVAKITVWLGLGPTLSVAEAFLLLFAMLLLSALGISMGLALWMLIMSFYLTLEEWQSLEGPPNPRIPGITDALARISDVILAWKLKREGRAPK
ncbi:MAG: hypothetical protein NZ528_00330 [Caldilineales bacterium]|nr:hypothetical protein [Caldilineales bacterium]MDW8317049.1 hypothetical protein [Anaerolineae bacterium]